MIKDIDVVLDKSYLRGAGRKKIYELCDLHNVLMPESLFFELLTTKKEKDRAICFGNFPDIKNPVVLVQGIRTMLPYEIKNKRPIKSEKAMFFEIPYNFNKCLKHLDFQFTDEQKQSISEWQTDITSRTQNFKKKAACVSGWFPGVKGYKPGLDPKPIDEAKALLCNDNNVVRKICKKIFPDNFPNPEILTEEWAIFRYFQVLIFAALEYVRKFGDRNSTPISDRIENEVLDLDYCVTALLVGALASNDTGMIEKFKRLQPSGIVISSNK